MNTLHTGQIRVHQDQELRIHKTKAPITQVSGYQNQGIRLPTSLRPNYEGIKVHQSQLLSIHKTKTQSIQVPWCTRNKDSRYYEESIFRVFVCTIVNHSGYTRPSTKYPGIVVHKKQELKILRRTSY